MAKECSSKSIRKGMCKHPNLFSVGKFRNSLNFKNHKMAKKTGNTKEDFLTSIVGTVNNCSYWETKGNAKFRSGRSSTSCNKAANF